MFKYTFTALVVLMLLAAPVLSADSLSEKASLPSSLSVLTWIEGGPILYWSGGKAKGLLAKEFEMIGNNLGIDISLIYHPAGRMSAEFKRGTYYDIALYAVSSMGQQNAEHLAPAIILEGTVLGRESLLDIKLGLLTLKDGLCDNRRYASVREAKVGIRRVPVELEPSIRRIYNLTQEIVYYPTIKSGLSQLLSRRIDCVVVPTSVVLLPYIKDHLERLFFSDLYPSVSIVMAVSEVKHGRNAATILKMLESELHNLKRDILPELIFDYGLEGHVH